MSDQLVVSNITYLLDAVLVFQRELSASRYSNTQADQMRLIEFVQQSSSPLIEILFVLNLAPLATDFRKSAKAIAVANPENDPEDWSSAIEDHRWFLKRLVVTLKSIRAHPPLSCNYSDDTNGMNTLCGTTTDPSLSSERTTSGLIIHEDIGKVTYGDEEEQPGNTIPYQILVIADKHFDEVVPYAEISPLWGKAGPTEITRRRNVSSVNTGILQKLGAPLELRSKRNTGIILRPIISG